MRSSMPLVRVKLRDVGQKDDQRPHEHARKSQKTFADGSVEPAEGVGVRVGLLAAHLSALLTWIGHSGSAACIQLVRYHLRQTHI